jgi:LCP family protein required for cell wall assembly
MAFNYSLSLKKKEALSQEKASAVKDKSEVKFYKRKWFLALVAFLVLILGIGGWFTYKTLNTLSVISGSETSKWQALTGGVSGIFGGSTVAEENGQTNILLMGMRGEELPGGGLLADSIMVLSLRADENKAAMISIPRDLYVKIPESEDRTKINAIYALGEENGRKKGLLRMKQVVGEVTGLNVHYAVSINFAGFKQLIDAVGGVSVNLETPFYEPNQFVKGNECGGEFSLPAGENLLDGETALCYVRARESTSDFDRAKRQQVLLKALKVKMISAGTLTSFNKVSAILDAIGDNVRTDIAPNEMPKFYEKYSSLQNAEISQRVFENSKEGMLKVPEDAPDYAGYILIPRAGWDDYSQIHQVCQNIFNLEEQSDIEPVKQYAKPVSRKKKDNNASGSDSSGEGSSEPEKTTKLEIDIDGELDVDSDLDYDVDLEIEEVEILGEYDEEELEIDLDDFDEVEEERTIEFTIEDLEALTGVKIISHKNSEVVLEIEVEEED